MILSFYIPTKNIQKFTSFPTFYNIISLFSVSVIQLGYVEVYHCDLISVSTETNNMGILLFIDHLCNISEKNICSNILPVFYQTVFLLLRCKTFLCCKNKSFIMLCNIFCQFYLLNRVKGFSFDNIHFIYLFVMNCDFGVVFKKSFPRTTSLKFSLMLYCFFYFCEKCLQNFGKDCTDSIDGFGQYSHFNNINSSNI